MLAPMLFAVLHCPRPTMIQQEDPSRRWLRRKPHRMPVPWHCQCFSCMTGTGVFACMLDISATVRRAFPNLSSPCRRMVRLDKSRLELPIPGSSKRNRGHLYLELLCRLRPCTIKASRIAQHIRVRHPAVRSLPMVQFSNRSCCQAVV